MPIKLNRGTFCAYVNVLTFLGFIVKIKIMIKFLLVSLKTLTSNSTDYSERCFRISVLSFATIDQFSPVHEYMS
jgi:hypothetical protein